MFQKGTATSDLKELVDRYNFLEKSCAGAGIYYHALSRKKYVLSRIIMQNRTKPWNVNNEMHDGFNKRWQKSVGTNWTIIEPIEP